MANVQAMKTEDSFSNIIDRFPTMRLSDLDIGRESMPLLDLGASFGRESLSGLMFNRGSNFDLPQVSPLFNRDWMNEAFRLSSDLRIKSLLSVDMNFLCSSETLTKQIDQFDNDLQLESTCGMHHTRFKSCPAYCTIKNRYHDFNTEPAHCSLLIKDKSQDEPDSDSIFTEAQHLSSVFSEEALSGSFMLNETDPPELVSGDLNESNCDKKTDKSQVFKQIDKLLPVENPQKPMEKKQATIDVPLIVEKTSPEDILKVLSELLSKETIESNDLKRGRKMIDTLSSMLSNKCKSITKTHSSSQSTNASTKKRASVKTSSKTGNSLPTFERTTLSNFSESSGNDSSKIRQPMNQKKRGPMKAIVPIDNLAKPPSKENTPKYKPSARFTAKIVTPNKVTQLKPMAQSTPDNNKNNTLDSSSEQRFRSPQLQRSYSSTFSPLANSSSSTQKSQLPRRNSMSEKDKKRCEIRRSSSLKESSIAKVMSKIRQNISHYKTPLGDSSNLSNITSGSNKGNMKSSGKENSLLVYT